MNRLRSYWPLLLCGPLLLVHMLLFRFVTDDAFISFVYARNLARHGELVFNLGERVEGYTNFLWTVCLAGLLKLGIEPEIASQCLGALFALGTLVLCIRIARGLQGDWLASSLPCLVLAGCGAYACWASGGLETQMFTFLLTLGLALYLEDRISSALLFALAALARPEGNLFFALVVLHRILRGRRSHLGVRWIFLYVALYAPYFAWRYHYYGWPFPNTFYIKAASPAGTYQRGLRYLGRFAIDYGPWLVLPLLVPPRRERRLLWSLTATLALGFAAYVVAVGGDFMGLYRFLVPVLPLLALAVPGALDRMPPAPRLRAIVAALYIGTFLAASARTSLRAHSIVRDDPPGSGIDTPAYLRKFAEDRAHIGRLFHSYRKDDDWMTVGGAGAQVYYADMRAIDAFGLTDAFVAHQVPATASRPGHQKWAPEGYLLSRRPTLLCHLYKISALPYVPSAPEAADWRGKGYRWVNLRVPGLEPPYYSFLLRRDRAFGPIEPDLTP